MTHAAVVRLKKCPKCDTEKKINDFGRDASRLDGRYTYCKQCRRTPNRREREIEELAAKGMKHCTLCVKAKPFCAFQKDSTKRYGYTSRCKKCLKEQRELKHKDFHENIKARKSLHANGLNRCWRCKSVKNFSKFLKSKTASIGVQNLCLECNSAIRREYNRKRSKANRDYVRWEVFESDEFVCYLCEEVLDPEVFSPHPKSLTIDHVEPIALGGVDLRENVRTACLDCNRKKNDMTLEVYLMRRDSAEV